MQRLPVKKEDLFFGYALLFQGFFVCICTVYRQVIMIPTVRWRPPLTKEYWFWFLDDRIPVVPYEGTLIDLCSFVRGLSLFLFFFGLVFLLVRNRHACKKRTVGLLVLIWTVAAAVCLVLFWYGKTYGQPYYLYQMLWDAESISLAFLLSFWVVKRTAHRHSASPQI